ncbi:unnamed protein product, partial [Effrenium voratum]
GGAGSDPEAAFPEEHHVDQIHACGREAGAPRRPRPPLLRSCVPWRISFNDVGGLEAAWDRAFAVVRAEGAEADADAKDVD